MLSGRLDKKSIKGGGNAKKPNGIAYVCPKSWPLGVSDHWGVSLNPPGHSWIRFLRNYGPIPTNCNLFDEHINAALANAKVDPIILPTPSVDAMVGFVDEGRPGSLLIAGTAGDGKTYHSRQLWARLGGDEKAWGLPTTIKTLELRDGRSLIFVKDLSELNDDEGDQVLAGLEKSVFDRNDPSIFVIASNHGQILDRLRKRKDQEGNPSPLYQLVQDAFLLSGFEHERLKIFDLSRTGHRQALSDILKVVTEHREWAKCDSCELNQAGRHCPIAVNRARAMDSEDGGRFKNRLADLIEIARLNGAHLPIRDLLALAANMLLGHPDAKEGLMSCTDVARIQEDRTVDQASIYRNVFGENLPIRRAMDRPIFRVLASFGIGEETTNSVDGLLVYGSDDSRLQDDFAKFVANDQIYGSTVEFLALQRKYLEGEENMRLREGANPFLIRLRDQRQRLFFTLPTDVSDKYPYWGLTTFSFAGEYLGLLAAVTPEIRHPVDDHVRAEMVQGLNRVLTGLLIDNQDEIFVASSGGFTQSKVSVLCEKVVPSKRAAGVGMVIRLDQYSKRPCLDISVGGGSKGTVPFDLTPVRFEFLCRVAEGALPSSFSNECFEDLLAFKARLLRQAELFRAEQAPMAKDDLAELGGEEGGLSLTFIDIEQNGHAFLKRISIRSAR